jgi:predicted permease
VRGLVLACRQLLRSPGFALAAVTSLALGIGANTAMFTLADALLFRPLPVRAPERLLRVDSLDPADVSRQPRAIVGSIVDAIRDAHIFAGVCGFLAPLTTIDIGGRFASVSALTVSGDCFDTLGVGPALGRLLTPDDDREGAPKVIAISYDSWLQDFGGRPDVLGRTVGIEGEPFRIVGVMEKRFPGVLVGFPARVYLPLHQIKLPPSLSYASLGQYVFARLRDGDAASGVTARLDVEWPAWLAATAPARLSGADRERYLKRRPLVRSAATGIDYSLRARFGGPLMALVVIAALVLLVAAVNVANLLLARAADRRRDTAVRMALGATRWQIARKVLLESGIVLVVAASAGVLVAYWCDRVLVTIFQATAAGFALDVAPDARALTFASGAAAIAFLIFALGPALKAGDVDITAFQSASPRTTGERGRTRRVVVVAQVAMTLVLVAVGSVFVSALASLRSAPLGVDVEHVIDVRLAPLPGGYPNGAAPTPYYRALVERLQALPGIVSVSLSADAPFSTVPRFTDVGTANRDAPTVSAEEAIVTDRFFETMKIPLIAGEDFRPSDAGRGDRTVIVSESLARRLFGSERAVGRVIRTGATPELQALRVIGVARDAVLSRPQAKNTVTVYQNWWQAPMFFATVIIRARVDPATVTASVRDELRRLGREYPERIRTLEEAFDGSLAQERLLASLSSSFSALGLALAAVGLYGLLAFTVASRTNEIGIRMTLGASKGGILRLVVRDALVMLGTGVAIGVPLAWLAVRIASRVLFDARASASLPIVSAVVLLAVIGAVAASVPALRASAINPIDALRHD